MPPDHHSTPHLGTSFPATQHALARHLPISAHLLAVQCFVRLGDQWVEAARLGVPVDCPIDRLLSEFDASQGGLIEPLPEGRGWLGRYMTQVLDRPLCFLLHFPAVSADQLTDQLKRIETHVGWIAVAVLSDCQTEIGYQAEDSEFLNRLLIDAATAKSRSRLAQQWVGQIERWANAAFVAVLWHQAQTLKLSTISGSGAVERHSEARSHLEAMARAGLYASEPLIWQMGESTEGLSLEETSEVQAGLKALELTGTVVLPIRAGMDQSMQAIVLIGLTESSGSAAHVRRCAPWILDALSQSLAIQAASNPAPISQGLRWAANTVSGWVGPKLWRLKVALVVLLGVILWAAWTPMVAEPGFSSRVEARQKRVVSAPFDGFIRSAPYRLGDRVPAGASVVELDIAEMQLELARQDAELSEVQLELQSARGRRDAAQVRRLSARESQIQIAIELLNAQITNSVNATDEASVVLGGDAWQRVGERVRLGEPLLELASAEDLRVLAFVDQDWITDVDVGIDVRVQLSALPDTAFVGAVESIGTDTRAIDGVTTFPVWISIPPSMSTQVMDGMRGVVRMPLAETTVLAYYTRGIRRWVDRLLWRWF